MTQQPASAARPVVFVLFGATGDLARRMVLPALYRLACGGLLPRQWLLVGNGRGDITDEDFRARVHDALTEFGPKPEGADWGSFAQRVFFAGGGFSPGSPGSLPGVLGEARASLGGSPQLVHYLAVPPVAFGGLTQALGQYGLADGARVVYEKPFGTSPGSFRELDGVVHSVLDEQQVYRIDHFLGKEATQDLHLLRFANGSSAAYWDRGHVESVQIDVPETLGISDRAQFYDATGAVLDSSSRTCSRWSPRLPWSPGQPERAGPAGGAGAGHRLLPAAGPAGGCAGPVRRLPAGAWCRSAFRPGHVRGRPGCGSTTPAGSRCRFTCAPGSGWPRRSSGSA
jgi:glucose-6-phosphate dehydrogenase-like protein